MRTKPGVDSLSFDDNNLRVFENDCKKALLHLLNSRMWHFVFENTSRTKMWPDFNENEKVLQKMVEKLQFDAKDPSCFDKTKSECLHLSQTGHFARECRTKGIKINRRTSCLETLENKDGENKICSGQNRYRGTPCSIECKESYATLKKRYDAQIENACDARHSLVGDHRYDGILSYENEVLQSVFMSKEIELENQPLYDRFVIAGGMHDVPPPMTGNYMPSRPDETVKNHFTHSKNSIVDKKGLGYGFITKACFVCGSLSHLIRDCDFHEKRMAKQAELNNRMSKKSSQRKIRPIWNNVQRVNNKNQFVPTAVLTRTGKIPVNIARASGTNNVSTARHNFNRHAVLTNATRKISTVKPIVNRANTAKDYPHRTLQNKGIVDSGCSRHMTGIRPTLLITKTLMICDKKNKVLFTDSECLVLSPEFKLPDENQVLLRIPRQNNMYSFNLENIVPSGGLACLIAKATIDKSNKWHRRLGHVNFKNLNKLVKGNLVRGLPSKIFQNDHTCVACQKGKQHKASCKAKSVFFLRTKDETSGILKDFIRQIENQLNQKVKTIRSDNGTKFKNRDFIELCGSKGIKREYSNARTPQQNGVAERKN
ncbi:putative ribonuclease H-like domain-containing protein, partial [Tanacetum coccineum]